MTSINKVSTGKIVNVVANDLNRIKGALDYPNLFIIPLVVIFTMSFLWNLYGAFSLLFLLSFFSILQL